jgi:hypothetical protein
MFHGHCGAIAALRRSHRPSRTLEYSGSQRILSVRAAVCHYAASGPAASPATPRGPPAATKSGGRQVAVALARQQRVLQQVGCPTSALPSRRVKDRLERLHCIGGTTSQRKRRCSSPSTLNVCPTPAGKQSLQDRRGFPRSTRALPESTSTRSSSFIWTCRWLNSLLELDSSSLPLVSAGRLVKTNRSPVRSISMTSLALA